MPHRCSALMAQSFVFAWWRQSLLARGSLRECDVTDDRLYAGLLLEQVVHHFQQRLSTRAVRPSATHVAWSVCLSVCLSQQYCEPYTRLNRATCPCVATQETACQIRRRCGLVQVTLAACKITINLVLLIVTNLLKPAGHSCTSAKAPLCS